MPELPEVETTRRLLAPVVEGRTVTGVSVARARMLRYQSDPGEFSLRLAGSVLDGVGRRGKYLLFDVESGTFTWVIHLGMSGRVSTVTAGAPYEPHQHVRVTLDSGIEVRFTDPRTFGFTAVWTPQEAGTSTLARLGPDARDQLPDVQGFRALLARRSAAIKAVLLDQSVLAGLGNIYADEVLHRARIAPMRPTSGLTNDELHRILTAIEATLDEAVAAGGTSLADMAYLLPDGRAGDYVRSLRVYGAEHEPCPRCGTIVRRDVLRGRSTHWCPGCQV